MAPSSAATWVVQRRRQVFEDDVEAFRPEWWLVNLLAMDPNVEHQSLREMSAGNAVFCGWLADVFGEAYCSA